MRRAITIEELTKTFTVGVPADGAWGRLRALVSPVRRTLVAVDRISLSIEAGERVAFVGPNGAGKSTTIKMLSGILFPTSGRAEVAGRVPWLDRRGLAYRIGTVFGQRSQLWYHLPPVDTFELLAKVYDQDRATFRRRKEALVEAFGIGPHVNQPVRELSLGQRMRCEIVASLLHAPEILFLDEPTIGLDVTAKATIREVIRDLSERDGCTVLLTSHDTADMEQVCERVIVINGGRVLVDRSLEALRRTYIRRKAITLQTEEAVFELEMPGVRVTDRRPHHVELDVDLSITAVDRVVMAAMRAARVLDLTVRDPPMDDVVRAIYDEKEPLRCLP